MFMFPIAYLLELHASISVSIYVKPLNSALKRRWLGGGKTRPERRHSYRNTLVFFANSEF